MKQRLLIAAVTALLAVSLGAQTQQPAQPAQPAQPKPAQTPTADPYANNPDAGKTQFPLAAPAGKDSGAKQNAPAGAANQGAFDPAKWKYGTVVRRAGRIEDLEPREAEAAAGRQGHRRHAVRRDRSVDVLRDGQRRLRLHLDRDAAWPDRLAECRADVAHLPAREGRARRARRLHRRARDSARARCRRARRRRPDRRHRRGSDPGAQLDLLPAARTPQQRRRPGVRRGDVGHACPAAIATPRTTTSC